MQNLQHQFPEYSATVDGNTMNFYCNNMLEAVEQIMHLDRASDYLDEWATQDGIQPDEALKQVDKFYE